MTDEADLEQRLQRALRDGLAGRVDVDAVASGARDRVGRVRVRRRRVAVAGVAALVAAVPLVVSLTDRPDAPPPVSTVITGPTPSGTGTPSPAPSPAASLSLSPSDEPTSTPHWTAPAGNIGDPNRVAYPIPKSMAFTADDFSRRMVKLYDGGDYRLVPTSMGQACGASRAGSRNPVAARNWSWAEENSDRLDQLSVDLVVTGWASGTGPKHWQELIDDTGTCRFPFPVTGRSSSGLPGDDAWAASATSNGLHNGFAAIRIGDLILAVQVVHPVSESAAVRESRRLVTVAADKARRTGLTATAG